MKKLRRKLRRVTIKVMRWVRDPDLDIIGVGVISTFAGRAFFWTAAGIAYASAGMWLQTVAFASALAMDLFVQFEVLAALRKLMHYEVLTELALSPGVRQLQFASVHA